MPQNLSNLAMEHNKLKREYAYLEDQNKFLDRRVHELFGERKEIEDKYKVLLSAVLKSPDCEQILAAVIAAEGEESE